MVEVIEFQQDACGRLVGPIGRALSMNIPDLAAYEDHWQGMGSTAVAVVHHNGWQVYRIEGSLPAFYRGVRVLGACPTCGRPLPRAKKSEAQHAR